MKNKLFILVLLIMAGGNTFAQTDSLKVYLEKNMEHKFGVDLVFENNYRDTILLITRFENSSIGGEILQNSAISIEYYYNGNLFGFNWGDMPPRRFDFFNGIALIAPNSKLKLFFNPGEYFMFPQEPDSNKYEVGFFMNYIYGKIRIQKTPTKIYHFETNRVTLLEPKGEGAEGGKGGKITPIVTPIKQQ